MQEIQSSQNNLEKKKIKLEDPHFSIHNLTSKL